MLGPQSRVLFVGDQNKLVECARHGEGTATFVCTHVRRGVACGFFDSGESPENPFPDAWCAGCEEVRTREGEWNDVSEEFAQVGLLCSGCYLEARQRNRRLPVGLKSGVGKLSNEEASCFIAAAQARLTAKQEALDDKTRFLSYPQWFFDDKAQTLRFVSDDQPTLVFPVTLVGSFSTKTNTWMWAWHNEVLDQTIGDTWMLEAFGEVRGIERMSEGYWTAAEIDCWEVAAVAAHVLGAIGVFRAPMDHQAWFMLLEN